MSHMRRSFFCAVVLGLLLFGAIPVAQADTITDGTFTAGLYQSNSAGAGGAVPNAYYGLVGNPLFAGPGLLNNVNNFDGFKGNPGRDAYGVQAGAYNGYVDLENFSTSSPGKFGGVFHIAPGTNVNNGNSATVTTFLTDNSNNHVLQITQMFSFIGAGNVLRDAITLTNVTATSAVGPQDLPVQFRRVDSLFVNPSPFGNPNGVVTVDPLASPVTSAAPYSYVPEPLVPPLGDTESPNPAYPLTFTSNGGTVNDPNDNLGGAFTLNVGTLFADPRNGPTSKTFNIYFADNLAGQSEADLRAELNSLGVNYIISDNNAAGPFVAAIGTQIIPGTPEPTTLALLGLGLAGLAGARWRRSRLK